MDADAAEDEALLMCVGESGRALCKELEEEEKGEEDWPPRADKKRRRRPRLHRMDVACLAVVGLVACIITVRQPALRTENPLLYPAARKASPATRTLPEFLTYADVDASDRRAYHTRYKARSLEVDGHATLLLGTDLPYASTGPETWEALLQEAKHDGSNAVAVDVHWEQHEPTRGVFNMSGGANLTRVYRLAESVGVFVHVRFHPRDCAQTADTTVESGATDVEEWREEVERFVTVMVAVSRPFLASHGGPIITAELVTGECASRVGGGQWTGDLLSLLNTSTPWITSDAGMKSYAVLECSDARDCEKFAIEQSLQNQELPLVWTRPLSGDRLPASQLAYHVARWFAVGGAAYIDHTTSETAGLTNSNLTETWRQQTRSHLSKLRHAIGKCSRTLTSSTPVVEDVDYSSLRPKWQRALLFGAHSEDQVVFLENADASFARVAFHGVLYDLAARSVVLLRNGAVLFNTSDVRAAMEAAVDHQATTAPGAAIAEVGR